MNQTSPRCLHEGSTVAESILGLLLDRRRGLPGEPARHSLAALAASTQFAQIMDFVLQRQPIEMALPAFPCKSPNLAKVTGVLPDEGERLALTELDELCRRIGDLYKPGARVTICSDGHVFADHIGVNDDTITAYGTELRAMLADEKLDRLLTFDLQDLWPETSIEDKRALLDAAWCEPPAVLRARARTDLAVGRLVAGMTKFLFEDIPRQPDQTQSQRHKNAKEIAYQLISRSQGWGRVVSAHFPRHLRLSIHPQPWGADKLGIRLLEHTDIWMTPWHSVVVYTADGRPQLMRHDEARTCGVPHTRAGRITHYSAG